MDGTTCLHRRYTQDELETAYDHLEDLQHYRQQFDDLYDDIEQSILFYAIDEAGKDDLDRVAGSGPEDEITLDFDDYIDFMEDLDDAIDAYDPGIDQRFTEAIERRSSFDTGYDETATEEDVPALNQQLETVQQENSGSMMKRAGALKGGPVIGIAAGAATGSGIIAAIGGLGGLAAGLYATIDGWSQGQGREYAVKDAIAEQSIENLAEELDDRDIAIRVEDRTVHDRAPLDDTTDYDPPSEEEKQRREERVREFVSQFEDIDQ